MQNGSSVEGRRGKRNTTNETMQKMSSCQSRKTPNRVSRVVGTNKTRRKEIFNGKYPNSDPQLRQSHLVPDKFSVRQKEEIMQKKKDGDDRVQVHGTFELRKYKEATWMANVHVATEEL